MQQEQPLSPTFSRRSVVLIIVFFAASAAFVLYRDRGGKGGVAQQTDSTKLEIKVAVPDTGVNARMWKFYFEDSVLRSGRKAYLDRPVDTHRVSGAEFYGLLREAGVITRLPQSDSSLSVGQ